MSMLFNFAVCPSPDLHRRMSLHNVEFRNHTSDLEVLIRPFEDVRRVRKAEYAAPETELRAKDFVLHLQNR